MLDTFQSYSFTFNEVAPSAGELLDFLRAGDSEESHPVRTCVDQLLAHLSIHNGIIGGYLIKELKELNLREGTMEVQSEGELLIGRQIAHYFKGTSHIALFVCTAGEIFTTLTKELNNRGDLMEAFVVDAIGSLTVERAMDRIQSSLAEAVAGEGFSITNRYSPGYCNWHLSGQKNLFRFIEGNPVGVSLSDSCLMEPIKSVSGIIGIGKGIRRQEYGCNVCGDEACIYRRRKG